MNLTNARAWVRRAVRDGNDDSTYSEADIDRAIQYVGQRFCRKTKLLKRATVVSLNAATATVDVTALLTLGFRPDRLLDVTLTDPARAEPLEQVDFVELNANAARDTSEATPELIAFVDPTTCKIWPAPDQDYDSVFRWYEAFGGSDDGASNTIWEAGASGEDIELNVPDEFLPSILADGAASVLLAPSAEKASGPGWQRYLAFESSVMGAGSLGAKVVNRSRVRDEVLRKRGVTATGSQ